MKPNAKSSLILYIALFTVSFLASCTLASHNQCINIFIVGLAKKKNASKMISISKITLSSSAKRSMGNHFCRSEWSSHGSCCKTRDFNNYFNNYQSTQLMKANQALRIIRDFFNIDSGTFSKALNIYKTNKIINLNSDNMIELIMDKTGLLTKSRFRSKRKWKGLLRADDRRNGLNYIKTNFQNFYLNFKIKSQSCAMKLYKFNVMAGCRFCSGRAQSLAMEGNRISVSDRECNWAVAHCAYNWLSLRFVDNIMRYVIDTTSNYS